MSDAILNTPVFIDTQNVALILANQFGYERIAMDCSASFAQMIGLAPERIEDLKTIVSEVTLNAMEHGNGGRSDASVFIYMGVVENLLQILITDEGEGIKQFFPPPDIDKMMETMQPPVGLGLYLIQQLADQVEFNLRADKGHAVKIGMEINKQSRVGTLPGLNMSTDS